LQEAQYRERVVFQCAHVQVVRLGVEFFFDLIGELIRHGELEPGAKLGIPAMHELSEMKYEPAMRTLTLSNSEVPKTLCKLLTAAHDDGMGEKYAATIPHDRVYALLGLAADTEKLGIVPDYTKPYAEVCTGVAAAIFLNDDDGIYQILTRAHKASLNALSWVPDWTVSYRGSAQLRQSEGKHSFKASGDRRRFVELRAGHGTNTASIAIQGTNVDIVSALFQYEWPQHEGDSFENHDIVSFRAFLADARSFRPSICICVP
jgi:hypothetical protein